MKLIAISGGVDSMVLADIYKNESNLVLAYVNYNWRHDSSIDQAIVENFASRNNLKLEKLILDGQIPNENLQNWARKIRYDFFLKIYKKYHCSELLVAHHKDDFLETALMQQIKNPNKLFFGIKQNQILFEMNIHRPLLFRFWKKEIYDYASMNKIDYHDDYTNFESKYLRNQIRNNYIKNLTDEQKEKLLKEFITHNQNQEELIKKIDKSFLMWKKESFSITFFKNSLFQKYLVTKFLNSKISNIKINKNIIEAIIKFILSNKNDKKFKLTNDFFLVKKNHYLSIEINETKK